MLVRCRGGSPERACGNAVNWEVAVEHRGKSDSGETGSAADGRGVGADTGELVLAELALLGENARVVVAALVEDSGADVAVYDLEGRLVFQSPWMNWWVEGRTGVVSNGTLVGDHAPADIAQQHMRVIREVVETGGPVVLRMYWREVRMTVTARPLREADGSVSAVMFVGRGPVPTDGRGWVGPPGHRELAVTAHDRGRLALLTPRELEVLALIAEGLTSAQIATKLSRSRKTVEAHRLSMGAKLGVSNRVELTRIALRAGLLHAAPGR